MDPSALRASLSDEQAQATSAQRLAADTEARLQAEIDSFVTAVRDGRAPEVSGEDGRRALELADRIVAAISAQVW